MFIRLLEKKNIMKNLLVLIVCTLVSIAQLSAGNAPQSSKLHVLKTEKAVILNLSGLTTKAKKFTVTDSDGVIVFTQFVAKYDHGVKYKLANLPAGQYVIKVGGDDFLEMYNATITNDELIIENSEVHFRPTVNKLNEKVTIDAILADKEDIQVNIYNMSGELVYSFNDEKAGSFNKIFNLEQLKSDRYNVIVSTDYFTESSVISI